jgi:hypothetical protein
MASNCSSAARKSSAISAATTSGSGRLAESSWASSLRPRAVAQVSVMDAVRVELNAWRRN